MSQSDPGREESPVLLHEASAAKLPEPHVDAIMSIVSHREVYDLQQRAGVLVLLCSLCSPDDEAEAGSLRLLGPLYARMISVCQIDRDVLMCLVNGGLRPQQVGGIIELMGDTWNPDCWGAVPHLFVPKGTGYFAGFAAVCYNPGRCVTHNHR